MDEPNWLDPEVAISQKIVLVDLDQVPVGEHRWSMPFRPDNFDGKWRAVCSCGQVFGPVEDTGELVVHLNEKPPDYLASSPKVIEDLFYEAREHAYFATTGKHTYDVR